LTNPAAIFPIDKFLAQNMPPKRLGLMVI